MNIEGAIGALKDPFIAKFPVELPPPEPVIDVKPVQPPKRKPIKKVTPPREVLPPPKLELTGIIYNTQNPQAIINGRVLNIGDVILGAKVLSVSRGEVVVLFNEENLLIKFPVAETSTKKDE